MQPTDAQSTGGTRSPEADPSGDTSSSGSPSSSGSSTATATTDQATPASDPPGKPETWIDRLLEKAGKLQIADFARLMGDNQRTLDLTHRSDQRNRDYAHDVRKWAAKRAGVEITDQGDGEGDGEGEADPMNINIDSPTTVNVSDAESKSIVEQLLERAQSQPQPAPQVQPAAPAEANRKRWPALGLAAAMAAAGLTGAAAPTIAWQLINRPAAPTDADPYDDADFELELLDKPPQPTTR